MFDEVTLFMTVIPLASALLTFGLTLLFKQGWKSDALAVAIPALLLTVSAAFLSKGDNDIGTVLVMYTLFLPVCLMGSFLGLVLFYSWKRLRKAKPT